MAGGVNPCGGAQPARLVAPFAQAKRADEPAPGRAAHGAGHATGAATVAALAGAGTPSPCPQYHRARRKGHEDSWCYWQITPGIWWNQWREPCADPHHLEVLVRLPETVYKLEADSRMIALYWSERGDKSVLQDIAHALETLA